MRAIISDLMIVCLYLGDLPISSSNAVQKDKFKRKTMLEFEMRDQRLLSYFLGM